MREFRVWHPTYKEFRYWGFIDDTFQSIPTGSQLSISYCKENSEQFTGLLDKNGNKIFEGDILDCGDRIVKVCWNEHCGQWDSTFVEYTDIPRHSNGIECKDWEFRAKIIGHIHEGTK